MSRFMKRIAARKWNEDRSQCDDGPWLAWLRRNMRGMHRDREVTRRRMQIVAGTLRPENGLHGYRPLTAEERAGFGMLGV